MRSPKEELQGISAIVMAGDVAVGALLDLAAVLQGLVSADFEILLVGEASQHTCEALDGLRLSAPGLPLRRVDGCLIADGCAAAAYDLVFVTVPDGTVDIRALNHLLDAIEYGADVAVAYRPKWSDAIVPALQRLGWQIDRDCAYGLFRRSLCAEVRRYASSTGLLWRIRHMGLRSVDVPIRGRRASVGTPSLAETRAA